jgi:hypothetical protein
MFPAFSGKQLYKMLERGSHAALGLNNCTAPGQCASPRACRTARRPCSLRKIAHNLRAAPAGHTQRRPQVSGSGSDSGVATCQKPSAGRQNHQNPGAEANTEVKERGFSFTLRTGKRQWQRQRRRHMPKTMRRATREQMLRGASTLPRAGRKFNAWQRNFRLGAGALAMLFAPCPLLPHGSAAGLRANNCGMPGTNVNKRASA